MIRCKKKPDFRNKIVQNALNFPINHIISQNYFTKRRNPNIHIQIIDVAALSLVKKNAMPSPPLDLQREARDGGGVAPDRHRAAAAAGGLGRAGPQGDKLGDLGLRRGCTGQDEGQGPRRQQHRHHRHLQLPGDHPRLGLEDRRAPLQRHT